MSFMFRHRINKWLDHEVHTLEHAEHGASLTVIPDFGANLVDLQLHHQKIIDGCPDLATLKANKWMKSGLLAPFPNRLENGTFVWEDRRYQFPINETTTNSAIHGFVNQLPFEVLAVETTPNTCQISLQLQYLGTYDHYPFAFTLRCDYGFDAHDFYFNIEVHNPNSTPIPFGFGWHPYFTLPGNEPIDHWELLLPNTQRVHTDARQLPTGQLSTENRFHAFSPLAENKFDNCFIINELDRHYSSGIRNKEWELEVLQNSQNQGLNYVQIFTPNHRKSIAIEPMSCLPNAFNRTPSEIEIPAGSSRTFQIKIRLQPRE